MIDLIPNILQVVPGKPRDFEILKSYHYQKDKIIPYSSIYKVTARYPYTKDFPDPIAVIVYKMPLPRLKGRTIATGSFFNEPKDLKTRLKLINKHIRYISRIVTDPRFRNLGIATKLIKESVELQTVDLIETLTPYPKKGHVFLKAGFQMLGTGSPYSHGRLKSAFRFVGITEQLLECPKCVHARLSSLKGKDAIYLEEEIRRFLTPYHHREVQQPGLERTLYIVRKLVYPNAYFVYFKNKTPFSSK